jgi:hypothetical protein
MKIQVEMFWVATSCSVVLGYHFALKMEATWYFENLLSHHITWRHNLSGFRMFQNSVMRRIFGPKREEVVGGWRRMHNEELRNLYASPNIDSVTN